MSINPALLTPAGIPVVGPAWGLHQNLEDQGSRSSHTALLALANCTFSRDAIRCTNFNSGGAGVYDYTNSDAAKTAYQALSPVPNVLYTFYNDSSSWMNGSTHSDVSFVPGAGSSSNGTFQTWVAAQVTALSAWLTRYSTWIKYLEIGNEVNEQFFWSTVDGTPTAVTTADQFRYWFNALASAALAIVPGLQISAGGITGLGASGGAYGSGNTFIQHCFDDAPGITGYTAISIHPYSSHSPLVHTAFQQNFDDIGLVQTTLSTRAAATVPVWVSEWSYYSESSANNRELWTGQAQSLVLSTYCAGKAANNPVTILIFFKDIDDGSYPNSGLFDSSFVAKPILTTWNNHTAKL